MECNNTLSIDFEVASKVYRHIKQSIKDPIYFQVQHMDRFDIYSNGNIFFQYSSSLHTHTRVKKESWDWTKYLSENLRLSWVVIDPLQNRAASLFRSSCKPLLFTQGMNIVVEYSTMMAGQNCRVFITCCVKNGRYGLHMRSVLFRIMDMNRELVLERQAGIILLNAIQNGERIVLDSKGLYQFLNILFKSTRSSSLEQLG